MRWWAIARVRSRRRVWRGRCRCRTRRWWWRCAAGRCGGWRGGVRWRRWGWRKVCCGSGWGLRVGGCVGGGGGGGGGWGEGGWGGGGGGGGGGLCVAAVNSPGMGLVSGPVGAVDGLVAQLAGEGVFTRKLAVDYASHCGQVEVVEQEVRQALAGLVPREPVVAFYSALGGG